MIIANFSEATSAPTESSYTVTDVNNEIIFFKKLTLPHTSQCNSMSRQIHCRLGHENKQ